MLRYCVAGSLLIFIFLGISFIFWNEEVKYSLPTPIPENYTPIAIGSIIKFQDANFSNSGLYLHFYNPDCPCSRFNAQHIRELIRSHGSSIAAYIVVPDASNVKRARKEFGEALEIFVDENGSLASSCGVYSTPQAVIINHEGKLYFRGNYNQSRYCTAKATNYAELALVGLLNGAPPPNFDFYATQSYGCSWQSNSSISFLQ